MSEETKKLYTLASDPTTPPTTLAELANIRHDFVRQTIARNPNTPKETLYKVGGDHPKALLQNPALPLFLLEDPDFFFKMPFHTARALLERRLPHRFIEVFLSHPDEAIRVKAAAHPQLPRQLLPSLVSSQDAATRCGVAKNPNTPVALLSLLANDQDDETRKCVARNPNTNTPLLERLAKDTVAWVRRGVAKNPNTPLRLLRHLATDQEAEVREGILKSRNMYNGKRIELLPLLASDHHPAVRTAVEVACDLLSRHQNEEIRSIALKCLEALKHILPTPS